MSPHHPATFYHNVIFLICVWLTYSRSCSGRSQCVDGEREALLQFKHGIHVDPCSVLDSWQASSQDCCQWTGIHCNNHTGHVIRLDLSASINWRCGLQGTLSASLVELKHLNYLDLSFNNFTGKTIPKFIGSLANLETLNIANNGFYGTIPPEIGNLSRLSSLDLDCINEVACTLNVKSLSWLSKLRLLRKVDLGGVDMSSATNWFSNVNTLPFLEFLSLDFCGLSLTLPSSLSYINSSTSLSYVSLESNNLNDTSIFEWFFNLTGLDTTLVFLDLGGNNQMFRSNTLEPTQRVMKLLGNLCSLQTLWLRNTNLNYDFSNIVHALSACAHKSIVSLVLNENHVWGSIPDNIATFSSLWELQVYENQLNGTLSPALAQLTLLQTLDLHSNSLKGVLTMGHLSNLTELTVLYLSNNSELEVDISDDWNPPFQLYELSLRSCKIGPRFPMWLTTQKTLNFLDISDGGISGTISDTLSKSLFQPELTYLNMSQNMIYGVLPDVPAIVLENFPVIDLSYNNLEGAIPLFLGHNNVSDLRLNNNKLSQGLVPFLCSKTKKHLTYLDLSNNLFSAKLPDCWSFFDQLSVLHLENNSLWGNLPASIGTLEQLKFLHLRNNNLSGELPMSLVNCTSLVSLDLAYNSLTGYIPPAFGHNFKNLSILILRSNHFSGALPPSLCHLSQLQILDVSRNHMSGTIPRCIYGLKGTTDSEDRLLNISVLYGYYEAVGATYDNEWIMWKRQERSFKGGISLGALKGIDMCNNKLEGQIPDDISSLIGLIFLNLSANSLSGAIPSKIGQMALLESLDLSRNNLSGQIPASLAQINDLGTLDVSYNHLSGKIPVGTQLQGFNVASYMGNPGLCGTPLQKCRGDEATTIPQNGDNATQQNEHSNADNIYPGMYISVVLGFIIGFWGVCGTLVIKRSWRIAFFRFYDGMKDRVGFM